MLLGVMRLIASSPALLGALLLASAASAAALPGALADGGTVTPGKNVLVRPKQIVYTGDGTGFLAGPGTGGRHPKAGKLKWSSWAASAAQGSGDDWINNCEPFCAAGRFTQHPVTITLFRPRTTLGLRVFTRMRVHYTHGSDPLTRRSTATFTLDRTGKQLFWNIPR
jgi:hypothetical protein